MSSLDFNKITTVEVRNFMCFTHEIASFDEKNIINFKGFNGLGKSAFLKAIAVCLMNVYPTKQVDFIRYGEDYFRVIVSFDDGVKILRDKYINGQSLYEMYKNGELVFSTKVGNKLTKVSDVPQVIKDYLALIENGNTGTGYLNFQTRKEPLWLIDTTGSENYMSLNIILKSGEISRASALINSDKNELNTAITDLESDKQRTEMQLASSKYYTKELLDALEKKEQVVKNLQNRTTNFNGILGVVEKLSSIRVIPEVSYIDTERYRRILSIMSLLLEIGNLEDIPDVEKLETGKLSLVKRIERLVNEIHSLHTYPEVEKVDVQRASKINNLSKISEEYSSIGKTIGEDIKALDISSLEKLQKIVSLAAQLHSVRTEYKGIVSDIKEVGTQLQEKVEEADKHGVKFVRCKNCGSYLRVNVGGKS